MNQSLPERKRGGRRNGRRKKSLGSTTSNLPRHSGQGTAHATTHSARSGEGSKLQAGIGGWAHSVFYISGLGTVPTGGGCRRFVEPVSPRLCIKMNSAPNEGCWGKCKGRKCEMPKFYFATGRICCGARGLAAVFLPRNLPCNPEPNAGVYGLLKHI